jgi:hypothetical protein
MDENHSLKDVLQPVSELSRNRFISISAAAGRQWTIHRDDGRRITPPAIDPSASAHERLAWGDILKESGRKIDGIIPFRTAKLINCEIFLHLPEEHDDQPHFKCEINGASRHELNAPRISLEETARRIVAISDELDVEALKPTGSKYYVVDIVALLPNGAIAQRRFYERTTDRLVRRRITERLASIIAILSSPDDEIRIVHAERSMPSSTKRGVFSPKALDAIHDRIDELRGLIFPKTSTESSNGADAPT